MFYQVDEKTLVCAVPKVGSQSIQEALSSVKGYIVTPEKALQIEKRIAFVRDPLERLISCFSHFWWLGKRGSKNAYYPLEIGTDDIQADYERFIDHVLSESDWHWMPQTRLLTHNGQLIPNILHPFEQISERWFDHIGGCLPVVNKWKRLNVETYRHQDLLTYYQDDFELRVQTWH